MVYSYLCLKYKPNKGIYAKNLFNLFTCICLISNSIFSQNYIGSSVCSSSFSKTSSIMLKVSIRHIFFFLNSSFLFLSLKRNLHLAAFSYCYFDRSFSDVFQIFKTFNIFSYFLIIAVIFTVFYLIFFIWQILYTSSQSTNLNYSCYIIFCWYLLWKLNKKV